MESDNILLRAVEPEDIDFILELENDQDNWRLSATLFPYSRYEIENFVLNSKHDIFGNQQMRLMIIHKDTQTTIGCVDLFDLNPLHRRAGIGIIISKEYRKKGFAEETLNIMSNYAFDTLGIHQLYCHIQPDNNQSIKLFTKLGYQKTGTKKAWEYYEGQFHDIYFFQLLKL